MRTFGLIGIVFWMALMGLLSIQFQTQRTEKVCGKSEMRCKPAFAFIVFLPIILWAGFRSGAGYADTNAYIKMYQGMPVTLDGIRRYLSYNSDDQGFTILLFVIKRLFGDSYTPFLFIVAFIEGVAVVAFYRKHSPHYLVSIFLFVASSEYFSWMFNGLRQFLAVSIVMLAFPLLLEKKYIKYFLCVALAYTMHATAIIMIPIALVSIGKPWNGRTVFMIAVSVFALVMTNQFTDILSSATQDTQYGGIVDSWGESGDDGSNPIRVMVYMIPTILALIGKEKLEEQGNPVLNISVNMSIFSSVLWLISMVTSGIYMGRLPIYASVFNYILLPYEIDLLFDKKSRRTVYTLLVVLYLLLYYYQIHNTWQLI